MTHRSLDHFLSVCEEEDEDDEEEDWLLDVRVRALYITIQLPYRTKTFHMAVRHNTTTTPSIFSSNREKERERERTREEKRREKNQEQTADLSRPSSQFPHRSSRSYRTKSPAF